MNNENKFKKAREDKKISLTALSKMTGISKSILQRYETGTAKKIPIDSIALIEKALNLPTGYLSDQNTKSCPTPAINGNITFPVMGEITANYDTVAVENWDGEKIDIPSVYLKGRAPSEFFVFKMRDDSMYPLYQKNDKVLIFKRSTLDRSGQIGAVLYDYEYITLKKLEYREDEDWIKLVPINPVYRPMKFDNKPHTRCRVIGTPFLLIRELDTDK